MDAMEEGDLPVDEVYDVGFNDKQRLELDHTSKEAQHRNTEIKSIQKSIIELAEIVKEMAILVVDQGTILDRIDYNIEMTSHNIDRGIVELEKSEDLQKKTGQKLCMILLIAVILAVILMIIVKVLLGF